METIKMTINNSIFVDAPSSRVKEYEALGYKIVEKEKEKKATK